MKLKVALLSTLVAALPMASPADAAPAAQLFTTSAGCRVPYHTNRPISTRNTNVGRLVLHLHGNSGNAAGYFDSAASALSQAGVVASLTTILIVPKFIDSTSQLAQYGLTDSTGCRWTNAGWKYGSQSVNPGNKISSYAVIDELVSAVANGGAFPSMTRVYVSGFSAGGQQAQRWLATSRVNIGGKELRGAVGAPSSFAYPGIERPIRGSTTQFAVPQSGTCTGASGVPCGTFRDESTCLANGCTWAGCPYDSWQYGWRITNPPYVAAAGTRTDGLNRLISRRILYYVGAVDTGTSDLDTGCAANLQGPRRLQRTQAMDNFMAFKGDTNDPPRRIVPGVGHNPGATISDPTVRAWLFN